MRLCPNSDHLYPNHQILFYHSKHTDGTIRKQPATISATFGGNCWSLFLTSCKRPDCFELPPTNFSIFTLKNVTWWTYLISFTVQCCFLFRFVCIIWFLQIWVAIYVYGTMINWSTLIKVLMQTYVVKVSGSNVSTVYLNGIWHLIWRYLSKPVLGEHPVLSGHYSILRGCSLNTVGGEQGAGGVQETGEERAGGGISTMAGSGREIKKVKVFLFVTAYFQSKKRTLQRFLTPI